MEPSKGGKGKRGASPDAHRQPDRRIVIHDVAHEAGVSFVTVSRALNGHPGVHPETRERILTIARRMGYKPRPSLDGDILYVMAPGPAPGGPCDEVAALLHSLADEAAARSTLLRFGAPARIPAAQLPHVAGFAAIGMKPDQLHSFNVAALPRVAISGAGGNEGWSSVHADYFQEAYTATRYLMGAGHRRLAMVVGNAGTEESRRHVAGARDAAGEKREVMVLDLSEINAAHVSAGIESLGCSAALVFSCGRYRVLDGLAARPGDQLVLVSLERGHCPVAESRHITTIRRSPAKLARSAFELLADRSGASATTPRNIKVQSELVERRPLLPL